MRIKEITEGFVSKFVTRGVEQGLARQKIQQDLRIMSNLEFEAEHGITKLQAQQDLAKAVPTPSTPPAPQWSKQQVIDYFVSKGKTAAQGAMAYERGWHGPVAKPQP